MGSEHIMRKTEAAAKQLNGTFRISKRGVPHVVVNLGGFSFSVCWFGKARVWRVFYPYPSASPTRTDCPNLEAVEAYIEGVFEARWGQKPAAHWLESKRGNRWRQHRGFTLTVFRGRVGFTLCVAGPQAWGQRYYDLEACSFLAACEEADRMIQQVEAIKLSA